MWFTLMLLRRLIYLSIFTKLCTGYLHESIGTRIKELNIKISPRLENANWKDFKNLQKFIDQKIDFSKLRHVFDNCNSLEEFDVEFKKIFESITI